MKQLIDRTAYSIIGFIALVFIEGVCTLGLAFRFEDYNWMGYMFQGMLLFLAIWFANRAYNYDMSRK